VRRFLPLVLGGLLASGCAPAHRAPGPPTGNGPLVAIYKAAIDDGGGVLRRAKLALWAERPDRLHAELMGPMGGVNFVLDSGGGQTCVVDVAAATAYVGADRAGGVGAIGALVGVRVSVADAVAALFSGAAPAGLHVTRDGSADGELPVTIRIADESRSIALTRLRFERGTADAAALGTGVPPPQLTVRPLEGVVSAAGASR
jgi:hypothetical protein